MKTAAFEYELPEALIAAHPAEKRDGARLLVVEDEKLTDTWVERLSELIPEQALLVVNDTRVRRARIFGVKRGSGGRVELLFIRRVNAADERRRTLGSHRSIEQAAARRRDHRLGLGGSRGARTPKRCDAAR